MRKACCMGLCAGLLLAAAVIWPTFAQAQSGGEELSPTLAQIKRTHTVRLGYRESSPPFSFLDRASQPIGYSLDLCGAVVDEIGVEVDEPNLKVDYVKVTPDSRIDAVVQNQVDMECGSTTANVERARQVAFSPLIYVAGTKLLVARVSGITAVQDMAGKTVVVTKDTTNEQALHLAPTRRSRWDSNSSSATTTNSPTRCLSTGKLTRSRPTIFCCMD